MRVRCTLSLLVVVVTALSMSTSCGGDYRSSQRRSARLRSLHQVQRSRPTVKRERGRYHVRRLHVERHREPGWIAITAGGSGSGSGTIAYSVSANATTDARTGALTIAGQTHTVSQLGRTPIVCTYGLSPGSAEFGKDEAHGTLAVSAPTECAWTATSTASWLVVTSGGQGTGNGEVSYTATKNSGTVERNAAITVMGKTFAVRQAGDVGSCRSSVEPVDFNACMPAGSVMAAVTTQAGCSWTVAANESWLTIPSGSSGTGPGAITIAFSENYDAPRNGILMVRWPTPDCGTKHPPRAGWLRLCGEPELVHFHFEPGFGHVRRD